MSKDHAEDVAAAAMLVAFLRRQLDRHEAVAVAALLERGNRRSDLTLSRQGDILANPVYVLADVAAKRATIDAAALTIEIYSGGTLPDLAWESLRQMAAPYAERDGFDPSWRPTP